MTNTNKIVDKAWNFAHVLRDDGLSYMAYTEQITFLLFLKMADEQSKPPYNKKIGVPKGLDWASLLERDGEELERHYRKILDELGKKAGMLGAIFKTVELGDTNKPEAIAQSNICFRSFLPSLTLWLSPNVLTSPHPWTLVEQFRTLVCLP